VGRALLRLLISKETELRRRYDIRWRLTGLATRRAGWLPIPTDLIRLSTLNGIFPFRPSTRRKIPRVAGARRADVLFEASSLDRNGQPAIDHLKSALEHGAHVAHCGEQRTASCTILSPNWQPLRARKNRQFSLRRRSVDRRSIDGVAPFSAVPPWGVSAVFERRFQVIDGRLAGSRIQRTGFEEHIGRARSSHPRVIFRRVRWRNGKMAVESGNRLKSVGSATQPRAAWQDR